MKTNWIDCKAQFEVDGTLPEYVDLFLLGHGKAQYNKNIDNLYNLKKYEFYNNLSEPDRRIIWFSTLLNYRKVKEIDSLLYSMSCPAMDRIRILNLTHYTENTIKNIPESEDLIKFFYNSVNNSKVEIRMIPEVESDKETTIVLLLDDKYCIPNDYIITFINSCFGVKIDEKLTNYTNYYSISRFVYITDTNEEFYGIRYKTVEERDFYLTTMFKRRLTNIQFVYFEVFDNTFYKTRDIANLFTLNLPSTRLSFLVNIT